MKKFILSLFGILIFINSFSATRTISALGGNYSALATWVEGAVPVASDNIVCLAGGASGQLTVDASNRNCLSIDFTNYTNTLTMNATLSSGNVTLVTGMTIAGSSALIINKAATLTSNTKTWGRPINFTGTAVTVTLADDWNVTTITINNNAQPINGNNLIATGSLTEGTTVNKTGTTTIKLNGTGTWSNSSTGILTMPLEVNGTITISGTVRHATNSLTFGSGVALTTTSSTLQKGGTMTVNQSGLTFATIGFNTTTFNGTSGFTVAILSNTTAGSTSTWKNGNTYTISSSLVLTGTAASGIIFVSASPTSQYTFTLTPGATCDVGYVTCTDADSSGGSTIWDYKNGTLTNTLNWNTLPLQPGTITSTFGN